MQFSFLAIHAAIFWLIIATGLLEQTLFADDLVPQQSTLVEPPDNDRQAAPEFENFCKEHFGAEKEPLAYLIFGKEFKFIESGQWLHQSIFSACVGFETNLPGQSYVEYGLTTAYEQKTPNTDRFHYLHLHYLPGLKPRQLYHYRLVATDERGNRLVSADKMFTTAADRRLRHIPEDLPGPPYRLTQPGVTYVVTQDLTIDGRAFEITAKDVTLDLGGHTIIYDNLHQGPPSDSGDFQKFIERSAFGVIVKGENAKIFNGTIRQGAGNDGAQANAIGFNPIYLGANNAEIAGVNFDYAGEQMTGICTHWTKFCHIHHNVVFDRGSRVTNRHQGCDGIGRAAEGVVHHNLLLRVRQRGLGGKEAYDNEIYGDSFAVNSYGIWVVPEGRYYANRIFGTGYHFVAMSWASGITVNNNFLHLQGEKVQARSHEYGERASVNGFRLTQYNGSKVPYENVLYHDNVVVVRGRGDCQMRGVQFFSDPYVKNLVFRHNLVKAIAEDNQTQRISCVVAQGNAGTAENSPPVLYEENTFISNAVHVRLGDDYGAGSNHQFLRCKFIREGEGERYRTILFDTNYPCKNHLFRDCTFAGGASLKSVDCINKTIDIDFAVAWTLTLKSLPFADVIVHDKNNHEVYRGKADAAGALSFPLTEYRWKPKGIEYLAPYTLRVLQGEKSFTAELPMDKPQTLRIPPQSISD